MVLRKNTTPTNLFMPKKQIRQKRQSHKKSKLKVGLERKKLALIETLNPNWVDLAKE